MAIAGLSLAQDLLQFDQRTDHVFGVFLSFMPGPARSARMLWTTAACFMAVGAVLVLGRFSRKSTVSAIGILVGYAIAATGAVAVALHLSDLSPAYQLGRFSMMAVHTAVGFIALGCGLAGRGWQDSGVSETGAWLRPALVGTSSLIVTIFVWQTLVSNHREQARYLALTEARHLRTAVTTPLEVQIRLVEEMSRRWAVQLPTREQWMLASSAYLRSAEGYQAIEVADANGALTWTSPLGHRPAHGPSDAARAQAIEAATRTRSTVLSPLVETDHGRVLYSVVPVYRDGGYFGAIIGVYRLTDQLMSALGPEAANDYKLAIWEGTSPQAVFGFNASTDPASEWGAELGIRVRESRWRLLVWPTESRIAALEGPIPSVLLGGGMLLSALACYIVFAVDMRRRRERELKQTTERLQEQDRQREEAQTALRASEERYRSLIDVAIDIIYRVDTEGRFTFVNPVAARVMKREQASLIGCHFLELVAPEARADVATFYTEQRRNRIRDTYLEFPAVGGDGQTVWIGQNVQMLVDDHGVTGFQAVARDITERKRADAELAAARDEALESTRLKSQFVANMSHELRTPMNGILGLTELLLETELTQEQRDHATTVRSCGETLLTILNDVLDLSKIEAGKMELHQEPFDIRQLIHQTTDLFEERARRKGVDLVYLVHHDVPAYVVGDPGRVRQVLTNLLGNAVKFTEAGEITVRVTIDEPAAERMVLRLEVADTGIGITRDAQTQLFRPFVQADGSITRRYGGTGLGLVISRQLSELMGGRLDMTSEPGRGSSFWFTIRLSKAMETPPVPRPQDGTLHGLRVLIVNDSDTGRRRQRELLENWHMSVSEAVDAAGGLAAIEQARSRNEPLDVVLVELRTTLASAFDFAAALKERLPARAPRLVMLVGQGQPGDAERARRLGAAAYLTKPIRQSQLFDCLATVMNPAALEAEAGSEPAALVTRHSIDDQREALREPLLVVEDNPVNQKVLIGFLKRLGYRADVASNGLQALEALERRSYELVFMDSQMPVMDGFAATAEIRRREGASRRTRIAAVTAHAMQGERERCLAAGMDDYLSKPYTIDQLAALVARWLPADGSAAPDAQTPAADTAAPSADPAADMDRSVLEGLRALETDAPGLVIDVLGAFLRDTPVKLACLAAALDQQDAATAERSAHGVKGSAGAIGATRMTALSLEIEQNCRLGQLEVCREPMAALDVEFARVRTFLERELESAPHAA
jgi:PAS domain S-box-containing protein